MEGRGQAKSQMQGCVLSYNISVNKTTSHYYHNQLPFAVYVHRLQLVWPLPAFYRLTHITLTVSLMEGTLFSNFKRETAQRHM